MIICYLSNVLNLEINKTICKSKFKWFNSDSMMSGGNFMSTLMRIVYKTTLYLKGKSMKSLICKSEKVYVFQYVLYHFLMAF